MDSTVSPPAEAQAPAERPRRLAALLAAAAIGAAWGVLETSLRVLYYRSGLIEGELDVPAFSSLDAAAATALSGLEHALLGLGLGLLALLVLAPLLGLLFPRRSTAWRVAVAPRFAVLCAALFLSSFWWSRFAYRRLGLDFMKFAYSEPFTSPKRLLLAALLAACSLLVAYALVARQGGGRRALARVQNGFLAAVLVLALLALGREALIARDLPAKEDACGRCNVVLIVVDALRAFNVGCYGYARETTPRIDALAREGVLFERAVAQAPYTWTSFGSLYTGKYPRRHGLLKMDPTQRFNPKRNVTLQRILDQAGYRTGAFMTGMISNASGLLDGFQTYFEAMVGRDPVRRASLWTFFRSELVIHALWNKVRQAFDPTLVPGTAVDWLEQNADGRFLAVIHLYSTHTPYDPPRRYDVFSPGYDGPIERFTTEMAALLEQGKASLGDEDRQRVADLYDAGVRFADDMIGRVVDELSRLGVLEETALVVTADHGEELGERGLYEHDWMYNSNQLVPLVLRLPERRGARQRVPVPVELIDVLPTLLELAGLPVPEDIDGESLLPWIDGQRPKEDDAAYCENNFYVSVQTRDWKLIMNRFGDPHDPPRLYHLAADPLERRDQSARYPEKLAEMTAILRAHDKSMPFPSEAPGAPRAGDAELMRQLGYLGRARPVEGIHERERAAAAPQEESESK